MPKDLRGFARRAGLTLLASLLAACSSTTTRADQGKAIASSAGLGADVADLLALAISGSDGTFVVTYKTTATDGTDQQVTITQSPPNRRVDVYLASGTLESTIRAGDVSYQCTKTEAWTCAALGAQGPGGEDRVLDPKTVTAAIEQLTRRVDDYDFRVEDRQLLGVTARCLVTTLKPGRSDPSLGSAATLCLAPSGAQLLVDVPRGKLEASAYRADVATDAFSLPAQPTSSSSSASS
ncbi:MAG: hypothetical protein ACR2LQ_06995 [Acidimicrobiales bacterium]